MRDIYIVGDISYENYEIFAKEMAVLEKTSKPITIHLTSEGGDAYASLAYARRIQKSPCHVIIKANGYVASAAVLILAVGGARTLSSESWVMVHEEQGELSGSVSSMEVELKQLRRLETQCYEILASYTSTSASTWKALHKNTTYLSAYQAFQLGLVDSVE